MFLSANKFLPIHHILAIIYYVFFYVSTAHCIHAILDPDSESVVVDTALRLDTHFAVFFRRVTILCQRASLYTLKFSRFGHRIDYSSRW